MRSWTKTREFKLVVVPESRREYLCVWQEERGDRSWYNGELRCRGYLVEWNIDAAQAAKMQTVIYEHGYRLIVAMRSLTAHELIQHLLRPAPRSMTLTVEL